jgi:hypothetical protein
VTKRLWALVGILATVLALPVTALAQQAAPSAPVAPRGSAVSLQDLPRVRIEDADDASHNRARKTRTPEAAAYTFLSATPGTYRRVTRLTSRLAYVEQLERSQRYVTFQGGLRVAVGR